MLVGDGKIKYSEKFVANVFWMKYVLNLHMNTGLILIFLVILKYLNFVTLANSSTACIEGSLNLVAF
jgi:Ni,Fe-hydrogenase I cytochrome b subunit